MGRSGKACRMKGRSTSGTGPSKGAPVPVGSSASRAQSGSVSKKSKNKQVWKPCFATALALQHRFQAPSLTQTPSYPIPALQTRAAFESLTKSANDQMDIIRHVTSTSKASSTGSAKVILKRKPSRPPPPWIAVRFLDFHCFLFPPLSSCSQVIKVRKPAADVDSMLSDLTKL